MSKRITRRGLLTGTAALASAAGIGGIDSVDASMGGRNVVPAWKPFMDQYYDGAIAIVRGIRDTQLGCIGEAMRAAYECGKNGGTVYSDISFGHYASFACAKDRPGQPWILPQFDIGEPEETFDAMKPGDFLLTHVTSAARKRARERGVFVAGVTNNYYPFKEHPAGSLRENKMALPRLEEMSDIVIDSQVPWYNGLVDAPQVSEFKLCPSSGIAAYAVYWACTATLATLMGSKGRDTSLEPARKYLDLLIDRLELVGTDRPKFDSVGAAVADMVLEQKPVFMVYGEQFKVSEKRTGNPYVSDAVGAASGSMIGQHYRPDAITDNDILLIGSMRSRQEQELEAARHAREAGAYVMALCPYATDGDSSGVRLFKEVDVAFNTYSDESEGVLTVKGFDKTICPTTGLTGLLAHWLLMASWTDHMARRGEMPYYWMGFHEKGGEAYDQAVRPYFMKRGY